MRLMYLTFDEYQDMGGALDETTFNDLEFEAENYINWYTFDRLKGEKKVSNEVKRCMFAIIKMVVAQASVLPSNTSTKGGGTLGAIQSQSNDGVSISYSVMSADKLFDTVKSEIGTTVSRYLSNAKDSLGRKLLYRGIYPNE